MTKRDILSRYKGSILGVGWSLFTPLMMLAIYTFIFSVVFKAKWGGDIDQPKSTFAVILFTGMIVFNIFSECFNRSTNLITSNSNYVNKVVFPLNVLPWTILCSAIFHALISLAILILAAFFLLGELHFTIFLLPIIWIPFFLSLVGMMLLLSSIGVYFRDLGQITGVLTTVLMFTSPLFFPLSALPEQLQPFLMLNPLAYFIEITRDVVIWGRVPSFISIAIAYFLSFILFKLGSMCFDRLKKGFADVI